MVKPLHDTLPVDSPGLDCDEFCCHFSFLRKAKQSELSACILSPLIQINGEATSGPWKEACR